MNLILIDGEVLCGIISQLKSISCLLDLISTRFIENIFIDLLEGLPNHVTYPLQAKILFKTTLTRLKEKKNLDAFILILSLPVNGKSNFIFLN